MNQHVETTSQQPQSQSQTQSIEKLKQGDSTVQVKNETSTQGQEQLSGISQPHPHDVLCGRGGSTNRHVGNSNFRDLVNSNKALYVTLTKRQKMMVARSIVQAIRSQNPAGRFLQKDPVTGLWFDIGRPRALEKTSQALREKASSSSSANNSPSSEKGSSAKKIIPSSPSPRESSSSKVVVASISPSPLQCKLKMLGDNSPMTRKTSLSNLSPPKLPKAAVISMSLRQVRGQVPLPPPPSYQRGDFRCNYPPYPVPLPVVSRRTPSPPNSYPGIHRSEQMPTHYPYPTHEHSYRSHDSHLHYPAWVQSDRPNSNTKNIVSPSNSYMHDPEAAVRSHASEDFVPPNFLQAPRSSSYPPARASTQHPYAPVPHHAPPISAGYPIRHPDNMSPYGPPLIRQSPYDFSTQPIKRPLPSVVDSLSSPRKRQRYPEVSPEDRDTVPTDDDAPPESHRQQASSPKYYKTKQLTVAPPKEPPSYLKSSSPWQVFTKTANQPPKDPSSFGGLDALSQAASLLVDIAK